MKYFTKTLMICALCLSVLAFTDSVYAAAKTRALVQTDLDNHKFISFEPETMFEDLTTLNDSAFNKATDTLLDITGSVSPDAVCLVTLAANEGVVTFLSASGESQDCKLPEATGSGAIYPFQISDTATSSFTIKINPATGDNAAFFGTLAADDGAGILYASATSTGSDTITLSATVGTKGNKLTLIDSAVSTWLVEGLIDTTGAGGVLFSSAVTSVD